MGSRSHHECMDCGEAFEVDNGGGFFFDLLHCDRCGAPRSIGHEEMGEAHLRYIKGLDGPYAVARAETDAQIRKAYAGDPLTQEEYESAVESMVDPCACGGSFRYNASPRCPQCRSTPDRWSKGTVMLHYD